MRYSVQRKGRIFTNGYWFLTFVLSRNIGQNRSKNLIRRYSQKLLDHAKQSATDAFKTSSKRLIQKPEYATGDLIGNKIANKISKI